MDAARGGVSADRSRRAVPGIRSDPARTSRCGCADPIASTRPTSRPSTPTTTRRCAAGPTGSGMIEPVVLTCNPLVAGFAPLGWTRSTTFFARDDWLSSPSRSEYWPAFREAYARIAASGRSVAAVSTQIIERIAPTGPHEVVPNGVEPSEWLQPRPAEPGVARPDPAARAPCTSARSTAGSTSRESRSLARAAPERADHPARAAARSRLHREPRADPERARARRASGGPSSSRRCAMSTSAWSRTGARRSPRR